MTRPINIGNGLVPKTGFEGPPIPPKKVRVKRIGLMAGKRKKSDDRICEIPKGVRREEYRFWLALRESQYSQFRNQRGFPNYRRTGIPNGMRKPEAEQHWRQAREMAAKTLLKMIEKGMI